jgi:SAM-dependent methyltransferase
MMKFADWLALREPADAAARATDLLDLVRARLSGTGPLVIHDLGSGTGSMGRWLAPRLPGRQHWIMYDRDPALLDHAAAEMVDAAADGAPVTVEARESDITRLAPANLAGAGLVVASALLDLLTADELLATLGACAGLPALFALTVVGRVALTPADPLDAALATAFDDHQRRDRLLGPDAVSAAIDVLAGTVVVRTSPWRLGAADGELTAAWLDGWVAAAIEQDPALTESAGAYRHRRRRQLAAGELAVVVDHADLLVLP